MVDLANKVFQLFMKVTGINSVRYCFHEDTVLHNARILNKDLSKVEKVILSHFHSDHTGGLIKLRKTFKAINDSTFKYVYVTRGSLLKDTQHQETWWVG